MKLRRVLTWKSWYYNVALPILRMLGPGACDSSLGAIGRLVGAGPARHREIASAVSRARSNLGAGWDERRTARLIAANLARYSARDYPLDGLTDQAALSRFDLRGSDHLERALASGRGVIVVGGHLGAHLPGLHWLYRRGIPLRSLIQRPWHISRELSRQLDRDGPNPQSGFFLRRSMTPAESVDRLVRARSALLDGMAVYLNGDVLWPGPNSRRGRFLGVERSFLGVWADLASLTGAPVVFLFAAHRPGGRYELTFDEPRTVEPGSEGAAVTSYLRRLEAEIAANPAGAVPYLLWPCFGPPAPSIAGAPSRIGRRVAIALGR
ncbi:lysophospholipid acyltransferase family protein [Tundrisphaera lichenicola]|uniref:lysophospholipid acyltransferase family protein n=1 Tax=Tundrisphaera lichenicola TaxID=2029860 RepID=UPI003EBE6A15